MVNDGRISTMDPIESLAGADQMEIHDVSETVVSKKNKRMSLTQLAAFVAGLAEGGILPLDDIDDLKAQDTTSADTWPNNKLTYIIAEDAFYAYVRGSSVTEDLVSKGRILPTTGGGYHKRLSNINRTFSTTSDLLTFLNSRPEGEVGQVRNSYGRLIKDVGSGISVSQADHSHDLDKSVIINDNASAVIVYDRSADTLLSITDVGFIPFAVKVNPFNNNQAAIRWRDSGFTTYKTTLVDLTTGVKTPITGAGTSYKNYIDFSSTRLVLVDEDAVRLVMLSGLAVTTITPLHSIDPNYVAVSPDGEYVAFAGNAVAKMGFIVLDDTSDVDYVDLQGAPASIGWSKDDNSNRMWAFAYTPDPQGLTTIFVNPSDVGVYVATDYVVDGLLQINDGLYSQGLMPIEYSGLIMGSLGDNLLWELDPYTGRMYTYSLPYFFGLAASDSTGNLIAYQGSDNNAYVFDRAEKLVHLIGNGSVSLYAISWGTAFNLMFSGDGVSQDVIYFSGMNTLTNGSYMQEDGVLIRLLPSQIDKVPYGGTTASGSGTDTVARADAAAALAATTALQAAITEIENQLPIATEEVTVVRTAHGFSAGQAVIPISTATTLARAHQASTSEKAVVVQKVIDANTYTYKKEGVLDSSTWSSVPAAGIYYLSDSVAGAVTLTVPTTPGYFEKVLFEVTDAGEVIAISAPAEEIVDAYKFEEALKLKVLTVEPAAETGYVLLYGYSGQARLIFPDGSKYSLDMTAI
jgi:hypothetical protein